MLTAPCAVLTERTYFDIIRSMEITRVETAAARFAALANPQRILIIRLLLSAYKLGGMTVGQIQRELGIPGSTLTHHLGKLEHAGLVASRRDRQWIWYSANTQGLREMLGFLFEECCTRSEVITMTEWIGDRQS